jgi:hypothetical protein
MTESDLQIFLEFYTVIANENIEICLNDISQFKNCLNFWLNFALNFKDPTFVELVKQKEGGRAELIFKKLNEILKRITEFLKKNLLDQGKNYY